tara:strand:- start:162 stop:347 length:186 start_codon:yes stop_codon:yes gene_type:complete
MPTLRHVSLSEVKKDEPAHLGTCMYTSSSRDTSSATVRLKSSGASSLRRLAAAAAAAAVTD